MGRNKKYPFYVKRIEKNKTTDFNFYKIIGPYSYIHVSIPVDSDSSISKYTSIKSKYSYFQEELYFLLFF